jgi:deoxyribose-phosphate aldolase
MRFGQPDDSALVTRIFSDILRMPRSRTSEKSGYEHLETTESIALTTHTALAWMIDHTLLRADATLEEIKRLCAEARTYGFAAVCVNPTYVRDCSEALAGTGIKVCTVIGFPLGATTTEAKVFEARTALREGAQELDVVINIGRLKSGELGAVENDIRSVVQAAKEQGALVKVIIETGLLSEAEKITASTLAKKAGADFVKTSTGFADGGASIADIRLIRNAVGTSMGIKASGGIKTREQALAMVNAGANRLGASASVQIVSEERG